MFYNLIAEMENHKPKITILDIADCLGVSSKTAKGYLYGTSKITWLQSVKIKHYFFQSYDIEYLFSTGSSKKEAI
jgi:Mn-dependent DtxR family transcriptional regulator